MKTARPGAKREALTRQRILGAALALVDREGLEAISMRRVGEALGVEAMSLYHHVANKAEILDGIFEAVLDELPPIEPSASWQACLRERAHGLRAVLRAHPQVLPLFATRPAVTAASLVHVERLLDVLVAAGFSMAAAVGRLQVLTAYVVGHTVAAYAPRRPEEESRPRYDRLSAEAFPRLREAALLLPTYDLDAEFALGLEAMLRGLALPSRPGTARAGAPRKRPAR
jgi:AcrR family transcriptional regulator